MIIGGIIFLIIINANNVAMENASIFGGDLLVQQLLISVTQIVESEFRNMGYKVDGDTLIIRSADSTAISFLVGDPNSSNIDTIKYFVLQPESLAINDIYVHDTQNPSDKFLYRQKNSEPAFSIGVVTFFRLTYFALISETDSVMRELSFPISADDQKRIAAVEIQLEVQNPYALYKRPGDPGYDVNQGLFSSSMWRQTRLTSQNLRK